MKTLNQIMEEECGNRIELFKGIFSQRLKDIRKEKGLSQNAVANKLGCAVSTYANWAQGRTEPSVYDIFNLLWVFGIDANELFDISTVYKVI